ncbi:MAG: CPBP family intramembrane metalloprotease [Chloroflexi bacterium]|nr:MAG: CPBP family intramembrane metalloprotease [Chloroflexota bacterium]RLT28306.1 MAG: CPBP family intramembrane metalloprotease [Chloroflexota bacterium]
MSQQEERPGLLQINGRAAPALQLLGLVASALGLGLALAGILGAGAPLAIAGLVLLGVGLPALAGASALQRQVDTPVAGWRGPGPVATFFATLPWVILAPVVLVIATAPFGGFDRLDPAIATLLQVLVGSLATAAVIGLTVVGSGAATWRDLVSATPAAAAPTLPPPDRRGGLLGDLAWGLAIPIPVLAGASIVASLLVSSSGAVPPSPLPPAGNLLQLCANLITAGLIAPIGEELLYRGVIAQAWGRQSGPRRAIIFSTLLFAFAHTLNLGGTTISEGLLIAIVAFAIRLPLGLALGWLWVRRRSLVATIMLHAVYNIAIVLISS